MKYLQRFEELKRHERIIPFTHIRFTKPTTKFRSWIKNGFNPFIVEDGNLIPFTFTKPMFIKNLDYVYFLNDEEVEETVKMSEKVKEIKELMTKKLKYLNDLLPSLIHHKILK